MRSRILVEAKLNELLEDNEDILRFIEEEGKNKNLLEKRYNSNLEKIEECRRLLSE